MTRTDFEYAAFISYNSADREIARKLQRTLEAYSIPKVLRGRTTGFGVIGERIGKVCRDRTDFKTGESLNAALTEALDKSGALIVLCSPDSARSKWVNAEVEHFQKTGRAGRIFPLIVRTDESRLVPDSFPPALRHADGDEAIAADLQETGDGWHDGVLKILASVLDVDFDALRQRALEAARRRTRAAYGVAGGMAGLAAIAAISGVMAVQQRNRSIENFEDAIVVAARSASRINELAQETEVPRETIHRFLRETEADLANLSAMESMKDRMSAQIVATEFRLLLSDLFAEVGKSQDQLASSLAAKQNLETIKKGAANSAGKFLDALLFGESNVDFYAAMLDGEISESLGKAWLNAGALDQAHTEFSQCRDSTALFLETWELDEAEAADLSDRVLACSANEANVLAMLNRPGSAIDALAGDIASTSEAAASQGFARLVLAQLYADNGRLGDAIRTLTAEIARYDETTAKRQERIELSKLLETRAKALAMQGKIADAGADLTRADTLLEAFLAGDSADRRALLLRGELLTTTGEIAAYAGERARAAATFQMADGVLTRLVDFDPARRDWRLSRARLLLARADNALRIYEGDARRTEALGASEDAARAALADVEAIEAGKNDVVAKRLGVIARIALARTLRMRGDGPRAHALLDDATLKIAADGASPLENLLAAAIADERGDLQTSERDYQGARANFNRSISLQRDFLTAEPSASLIARDLLWTSIASAKSLRAAGDMPALKTRLAEACALKSASALSEYSLFARDAETLETLAEASGVTC
ncbi:MAG: TIR domain-containing protein [Parvularculaceae bacterium]|nr:TIR domain-containing protein [Parvularculaceae bacterium]